MDTIVRDVRQTVRLLASHRGFAVAALVTIALGVGGTAAVFSVVYGVLLRPLPYPEPAQLMRISERHRGANAIFTGPLLTHLTYRTWMRDARTIQELAGFYTFDYTVTGLGGGTQRVRGATVTPSLFRVLRVTPISGRFFDDSDADPGAAPVVILTYDTWRERFGSTRSAIGQTLIIGDKPHAIVGVAPPGFSFPGRTGWADNQRTIAIYTPYTVPVAKAGDNTVRVVSAIARLKPGVTIAQAEAEGTAAARSIPRPPVADLMFGKGGPVEVRVQSMVDEMTHTVRPALLVLAAGVGLVLLIACANVANLFLSRGSVRTRELAVRAALGASRRRLMRQLLTESLVISTIGGTLGLFIGWAMTASVPALAPATFPRLDEIHVDARFLIVAALAAIFVGVVAGLLPAVRSSRVDLSSPMHAGDGRSVGASGGRIRRALLVVEAALAVVMLVGATLLARSFVALVQVDAGYDSTNVFTADLQVTGADTAAERSQRTAQILDRLRAIPGVRAAGAGSMAPFGGALYSASFDLPGMTTRDGKPVTARALNLMITPGYAEALGLRLKEGRFFRADDMSAPIVAMLVNETFARTYFNDGKPVTGRRFVGMFPRMRKTKDTVVDVVGVVQDTLMADLDAKPQSQIYLVPTGFDMSGATLVVKTDRDPASIAPHLRQIAREVDPRVTLDHVGPLADKISASVAQPRFAALVLIAFATLALALATTGLYGVLSYMVAQRRREIGVRAALGATRADLVRMVLREGLLVTIVGLAIGCAAAMLATRAMASALFGVTPLDAVAFSVGPVVLFMVACAACFIPARRAASIDPTEALRSE
jgi:putative ABC transport system permease protein